MVSDLKPDLIILDVMMPDIDGFEVCTRLRKLDIAPILPILMVTGLDDLQSIERAFKVGATNFLTKPINFALIHYHVKYMLRSSSMERELRAAKTAADEANQTKTQFLANTSHELRTPLNAIIGFSELMHNEVMGPLGNSNYKQYADDIAKSGRHLLELLNDILDISKIESGKLEVRQDECDLPKLLKRVLRLINPKAAEAGVSVDLHVEPDLPAIYTDELRLKQVVLNLVSNAVKFSHGGDRVTVRAKWPHEDKLVIEVTDTGIGIAEDKIEKALSMFGQVDGGLARRHEGTGLGLPLSIAITQLLGGQLSLTSEPGAGTVVTLEFPSEAVSRSVAGAIRKFA